MTEEEIITAAVKRAKEVCVVRSECERKNCDLIEVLHKIDTRLSVIESHFGKRDKLGMAVATAVISCAVTGLVAIIVWAIRSGAV